MRTAPKAIWGFFGRLMSKASARSNTLSSRFPAASTTPMRAPLGMKAPPSSVSHVVWRGYMPMGEIQRTVSSNTAFQRAGSAITCARCSGWDSSA